MNIDPEVLARIPHRPPFLWVDLIIEQKASYIVTQKHFPADLDVFRGHYPHKPIVPGVLLCEAIFQSGALLMSFLAMASGTSSSGSVPVLTRIGNARFKRIVNPGDEVEIRVELQETISSVSIMKGTAKVAGKTAVQVEFSCAHASS
jgi:3-hydroxyacyl-[acyl-carrier-protein] dehydratase